MRGLKFFNLVVITAATLFTLKSLAATPLKVHVLENLTPSESKLVYESLTRLGYAPSKKALFSESKDAFVITKVLKNELESESLTVELIHLDHEKAIPRTVFQYRMSTTDINTVMNVFPKPHALQPLKTMPVALLSN